MAASLTVIILTYNEEMHISRCIDSVSFADEVVVVDSFSTDKTTAIAQQKGAKVFQNPFVNQAVQFNWALANCNIQSDWILRIDADEYIDNNNNLDLKLFLSQLPNDVNGLHISRKIVFMGQPLNHGGWYPKWNLRIFKNGKGACENRWMDEHIVLSEGRSERLQLDFVDENLNELSWWINKHNSYASREAIDYFLKQDEDAANNVQPRLFGNEAERKRWLKQKYQTFPLFIRPFFNFAYRYFLKLGFLDGKAGFIWHVLQGFWYRFLVDAKIFELKKRFNNDKTNIISYLKKEYGI